MRLLQFNQSGRLCLTKDLSEEGLSSHPYAILSHTWGTDDEEVSFADLTQGLGHTKVGNKKLRFCEEQATNDSLHYFGWRPAALTKTAAQRFRKPSHRCFAGIVMQ
jgi:hypothetical protein